MKASTLHRQVDVLPAIPTYYTRQMLSSLQVDSIRLASGGVTISL